MTNGGVVHLGKLLFQKAVSSIERRFGSTHVSPQQVENEISEDSYESTEVPDNVEIVHDGQRRVVTRTLAGTDGPFRIVTDFPDALTHPYGQHERDAPIVLHQGRFFFAPDGGERELEGHCLLEWRPVPRLEAFGRYVQTTPAEDIGDLLTISGEAAWAPLPWVELAGGAFPHVPTPGPRPAEPKSTPRHSTAHAELREMSIGGDLEVERATFAICNGWEALDVKRVSDPVRPWQFRAARLEVPFDAEYVLTIDAVPHLRDILRELKRHGGVAITHIGCLARKDGSRFRIDDCVPLFNHFRLAVSIGTGRRIDAVLPVGHAGGKAVSTRWNQPRVDDYRTAHTMLDPTEASAQLGELLRDCHAYCASPEREALLHHATSYYIGSNRGTNLQLACAQVVSGLQLLSFFRLVTEGQMSRGQWDSLTTIDQLRALLNACSVPTAVTPGASEFARAGAELPNPTSDGLEILIKMRNVVIHPSRHTTDRWSFYQWFEAWCAARELLLLAILNTVNYGGSYRSILEPDKWLGSLNQLPWLATDP